MEILNQHTRLIHTRGATALAGSDLAWGAGVAGRDVEGRVSEEEVARPQQHGHRLGGHDGVVLWRWEMGEAKRVPEHNVLVRDVLVRVAGNPRWQALRGLT